MKAWTVAMSESAIAQTVEAGPVANMADFMAYVKEQQPAPKA
jgi:hypothetical protein